ncbi:universal stress protein family-domain-containing protein [Obelidium mucronatum]|nr:universal stress protein family-domain-containing protein [Obelidium mucronatum]
MLASETTAAATTAPRNIFVALDESDNSCGAFHWVLDNIALTEQDTVTAIVVTETEADREVRLSHTKTFIRALADPDHLHVKYAVRVLPALTQSIGVKICELVDEVKPNLLVVGSGSKSTVEGFLLGSVSNYCIANANCPVIVARVTPADEVRAKKNAQKVTSIPFDHAMWV